MRALDRKLLRDLWHLRGQVLAIGLVIAAGVAVLVMSLSTQRSLLRSADAYYDRYAFADVFASLKRAPEALSRRIAQVEGVQSVETRVVGFATLAIEDIPEPVTGQFVSLPDNQEPTLNQLAIRSGRGLTPGRNDEVILNEPFAETQGFGPGDQFVALLNGQRRNLTVVGTALSPEFIYSLGPGALMPDDRRFGVIWMGREALAAAFDLEGSFNSVSLRLQRGTSAEAIIPQLDQLLQPYGGVGAIARADQLSNWFVTNEIAQLGTMAKVLPAIFLLVSAFLTNMVLARLIATERSQIGLMKAFGYSNFEVGGHYVKFVLVIGLIGVAFGLVFGAWFGRWYTAQYAEVFRFPVLLYRPSGVAFSVAAGATLTAALLGAMGSVLRAARLPPAEAMNPPAPPTYRLGYLAATRFGHWLDQPTRILLRHISRNPVRSLLTCVGTASAVALLVLALQWRDALGYIAEHYFFEAQHQDLVVGMVEPQSVRVVREFERMPGVLAAEATRGVAADFQNLGRKHRGSVTGVGSDLRLQPIFDDRSNTTVALPPEGLVIATRLAEKLEVGVGDHVWVHILEGRRPWVYLPVVRLFETQIGLPAYIHINALNRILRESERVGYVSLLVDSNRAPELFEELKSIKQVAAVLLRQAAIDSWYENVVSDLMKFVTLFSAFACALGFGVAYNATRISLSERGRELATLRVLGFTRAEISYILLGEVMLLVCLGLPLGCVLGLGLTEVMAEAFNTELFRVPVVIQPQSYGLAAVIALTAALLSVGVVRRRLDRLNLIEVLKTRE